MTGLVCQFLLLVVCLSNYAFILSDQSLSSHYVHSVHSVQSYFILSYYHGFSIIQQFSTSIKSNASEWIIGGHHWFNVSGSITLRYRTNFTSSSCKDYLGTGIQSQKMDDLILQSKGEGRMEEGLRFLLTLVAGDMTKSQLVVVVNQPSRVELSY